MSSLQTNVSLRDFNTLRLQSEAACFTSVTSLEDILASVREAQKRHLPLIPLGEGSNVILGRAIDGLVVHMNIQGREVIEESKDDVVVRIGAGETWHDLVLWAHSMGYYGLENLALIPGSVGAAPVQNIGAYGVEVEKFIDQVEVVHRLSGDCATLTHADCTFGYRDSIFKREKGSHWLITSVVLRLSKKRQCCLEYPALRASISDEPVTPESVLDAVIAIRTSKLPDPNLEPNVGSFFKNPVVSQSLAKNLNDRHQGMPQFPTLDNQTKLSSAWMIDYLGWRGKEASGVMVSERHALVLINKSASFATEVISFSEKIKESVRAEFSVDLEVEPQLIGLDS